MAHFKCYEILAQNQSEINNLATLSHPLNPIASLNPAISFNNTLSGLFSK